MNTHREEEGIVDGICVDCVKIYDCCVRLNAEQVRGNHIIECSRFIEDTEGITEEV